VISAADLDAHGTIAEPRIVLERDHHLSYPFVFVSDGSVFMIPESSGDETVELLEAVEFPHLWAVRRVLLRGLKAYDSTVLEYDGRWWLFATVARRGTNSWDDLFLFYADSIDGPWIPHPRNPVVSDTRSARPAGRILEIEGRLLRPAQDCSNGYGSRVVLNHIEILTAREYREVPVATIEPAGIAMNERTHCYALAGDMEVVDGYGPRMKVGRRRVARRA
jgi:hypothetical protein